MGMPTVLVPLRGRVKLIESESTRILPHGPDFRQRGCTSRAGHRQRRFAVGDADRACQRVAPVRRPDIGADDSGSRSAAGDACGGSDGSPRRRAPRTRNTQRHRVGKIRRRDVAVRELLLDLQSAFDPLIRRCPGRALGQRRGVFLRLQRVCNYMESSSDLDLGIAEFARVANYSPCHFLRTFNSVYGKTPHAVLVEQRLRRALRLVHETALSIAEVAHASGFENRCAFSRSFKRRFGETATAVRERGLVAAALCE